MDILITSCPASGQILSILAKRAPEASERQGGICGQLGFSWWKRLS